MPESTPVSALARPARRAMRAFATASLNADVLWAAPAWIAA